MIKVRSATYRWVVLAIFSLLSIMIQVQWLTYAPIAREVRDIYQVSPLAVDLLSMIFMLVFLLACFPASSLIEKYDLRIGIGIGAVLMAVFALLKGFFAESYAMALVSQLGLAVAQPFFLNAATKLAKQWFPVNERVTAVGIATLAQFAGVVAVMILTPLLFHVNPDGSNNLQFVYTLYGIAAAVSSLLFFILVPASSSLPGTENGEQPVMSISIAMKTLLKKPDMIILVLIFFIGLGQFNAISTCIDQICEKKSFSIDQTGMIGGIMLIAGIAGALVFPLLSDYFKRRKLFMVLALALTALSILVMSAATSYNLMFWGSFALGFFLLGAGAPVGFQYGAEMGAPVPEAVTQGLILFIGQLSGIIFIILMNLLGMIPMMYVLAALGFINLLFILRAHESTVFDHHKK